jgi:hypothetical protein
MLGGIGNGAVAMLMFDIYLFDEFGHLMQQVPIQVTSEGEARERATYFQKTQRATSFRLMPYDIRCRQVDKTLTQGFPNGAVVSSSK